MKKGLLLFLIFITSVHSHSQITFEKGYYITNSGERVDCLIKNIDWKNNPVAFTYKLSENSEAAKETIESVQEFGIDNALKYERHIVDIDLSSNNINMNQMSISRAPEYIKRKLFLNVLIEGKANLYFYQNGNLKRYFYSVDKGDITQLVYKKYKTDHLEIGENKMYRQQLLNNLKCQSISQKRVANIGYVKRELTKFFIDYNECNGEKSITHKKEANIGKVFNLTLRPGIKSSSFSIKNDYSGKGNTDFGSQIGARFGIEAECILPFNKNKWSVFIEPTYQYFSETETMSDPIKVGVLSSVFESQKVKIEKYTSIDISLGARHYMFLNQNSKIFIDAAYIFSFGNDLIIDFESMTNMETHAQVSNMALGIGYNYKRYSLELQYQTPRELLSEYYAWKSNYTTISVIFGVTIL